MDKTVQMGLGHKAATDAEAAVLSGTGPNRPKIDANRGKYRNVKNSEEIVRKTLF